MLNNPEDDIWWVPYRYYRLTKIKMYKNSANTSGFEVTYEPPDTDEFVNWPTETRLFGYDSETIEEEEIEFEFDL